MCADDVTWRLNHSLAPNVAGPHVGKAAVTGFNEAVLIVDPATQHRYLEIRGDVDSIMKTARWNTGLNSMRVTWARIIELTLRTTRTSR
jgi:hypothetical protein